jgi:branched-chain amino acid transport system permease protein
MYALVALGYTMVYGIINLINFAHGEVLMVGALTSWTVVGLLQDHVPGMPGWLMCSISLLVACVVAATLNFAIEKIAYRPLRGAPKLAPLITAIGMSILLQTLAMIIWKPNYKAFPTLLPADPIDMGGAVITPTQIMILGVTAISLALLMWLVNGTRLGRAMRADSREPARGHLDGCTPGHHYFGYLHHWRGLGGFGRCDAGLQLRHGATRHGFFARLESLYCGGVWWHW